MNEQLEEQAALYVFGLLDPQETAEVEEQCGRDPELRKLVDEFYEAAAAAAHSAPERTLPPELKQRILAQAPVTEKVIEFPKRSWWPTAIAAGFALLSAFLFRETGRLEKQVATLEQRDAISQLKIATLSSKLTDAPAASAVVLWDEKAQRGVLKVVDVPPNSADRDYQLWVVDSKYKDPVDGGTFHVAKDGTTKIAFTPSSPIATAKAFAISLERKGGVPKAEGPIVLVGNSDAAR